MGSLCFSSASILRCEAFSSLESQILIVPTALELIFASTLIFTNRGNGWRHFLLTAEAWSYFALALLELLSHTLPAVRDSVTVFSVVDIVLGATSFIPLFFYTLFVYMFTRGELVGTLPLRMQNVANVLLVAFIPTIVAFNELSSFVGISRRTLNVNGHPTVAIGFRTSSDQQLWTFLSSLNLAFLAVFQATNFSFAFYRLIRAFVDQRRIETTASDQAHPIRGIGWISAGLKLGAIETVIGFASAGFAGVMTRRIVRFLSRACLVVGAAKGIDSMDDFVEVRRELDANRKFRRSRIGNLISNPRFSTFQQLTPTATTFYDAPRAAPTVKESPLRNEKQPEMAQFAQLRREATMADRRTSLVRANTFASTTTQMTTDTLGRPRPRDRVTVHYGSGAPTLQMRFSGLDMPSPAVIAESVKSRPVSSGWVSIARSSRYAPSATAPSFAFDAPPVPVSYPDVIYDRGTGPMESLPVTPDATPPRAHRRGQSAAYSTRSSAYPDSLYAVHELAEQFPSTPGQQTYPLPPPMPMSEWHDDVESQRNSRRSYDEIDSAYAPSAKRRSIGTPTKARTLPVATAYASPEEPAPPLRYAYGGMEYPESPEPVYRYRYDATSSPEEHHSTGYSPPVINPDIPPKHHQHRPAQSDTTLGMTPMTVLSPFADPSVATPATTEDRYSYDDKSVEGVPQAVYMEDGPHSDAPYTRTSAALLQMTQQENVGWAPAEFTPSMFESASPSTRSAATTPRRGTLKKKRPNQPVSASASAETFASSWLQGESDPEEQQPVAPLPVAIPGRIKSVGRQRAVQKATPVPKLGVTRGSVYIQPITVPPQHFHSEVQIVQGSGSADSSQSEFAVNEVETRS